MPPRAPSSPITGKKSGQVKVREDDIGGTFTGIKGRNGIRAGLVNVMKGEGEQ